MLRPSTGTIHVHSQQIVLSLGVGTNSPIDEAIGINHLAMPGSTVVFTIIDVPIRKVGHALAMALLCLVSVPHIGLERGDEVLKLCPVFDLLFCSQLTIEFAHP